jgi:hypothetical protein
MGTAGGMGGGGGATGVDGGLEVANHSFENPVVAPGQPAPLQGWLGGFVPRNDGSPLPSPADGMQSLEFFEPSPYADRMATGAMRLNGQSVVMNAGDQFEMTIAARDRALDENGAPSRPVMFGFVANTPPIGQQLLFFGTTADAGTQFQDFTARFEVPDFLHGLSASPVLFSQQFTGTAGSMLIDNVRVRRVLQSGAAPTPRIGMPNGDFELPVLARGHFTSGSLGLTPGLAGAALIPNAQLRYLGVANHEATALPGGAFNGQNVLELGGRGGAGVVTVNVGTSVPGESYRAVVHTRNRADFHPANEVSLLIVSAGATLATSSLTLSTGAGWTQLSTCYDVPMSATPANLQLQLQASAGGVITDFRVLFDDLRIERVPSCAP